MAARNRVILAVAALFSIEGSRQFLRVPRCGHANGRRGEQCQDLQYQVLKIGARSAAYLGQKSDRLVVAASDIPAEIVVKGGLSAHVRNPPLADLERKPQP